MKRNTIKTMVKTRILRNTHLLTAAGPAGCSETFLPHRMNDNYDDGDGDDMVHGTRTLQRASLNRILARQMECEKQFKSNASG